MQQNLNFELGLEYWLTVSVWSFREEQTDTEMMKILKLKLNWNDFKKKTLQELALKRIQIGLLHNIIIIIIIIIKTSTRRRQFFRNINLVGLHVSATVLIGQGMGVTHDSTRAFSTSTRPLATLACMLLWNNSQVSCEPAKHPQLLWEKNS